MSKLASSKSVQRLRPSLQPLGSLQSSPLKLQASLVRVPQSPPKRRMHSSSTHSKVFEVKQIEQELTNQLKQLALTEPISHLKFQAYQEAFAKIVTDTKPHQEILAQIKAAYDKTIERQANELNSALAQIEELQKTLLKEQKEKKDLKKQLKVQTAGSQALSRQLKDKEFLLADLNKKLCALQETSKLADAHSVVAFDSLKSRERELEVKLRKLNEKYRNLKQPPRTSNKTLCLKVPARGPDNQAVVKVNSIYIEKDTLKLDSDSPNIPSKFTRSKEPDSLDFCGMSPINVRDLPEF